MESNNAIEVHNIKKKFRVYLDKGNTLKEKVLFRRRREYEERTVLNGITFSVKKGESIGLIGHNGCGKSTTLKLLSQIMYPDSGEIEMCGRISSLIELGAGFHPDMSGRENIYINASIFGLSKKEIDKRLEDIIAFSELEDFIDNPVRTYSSGMYMRLAFSVAINVDADILLIDEILAVGDTNFQTKCFNKLREIKAKGVTIILVTHDLLTVEKFCDIAIWLNDGKIVKQGNSNEVIDCYMNYMNIQKIESVQKDEERKKKQKDDKKEEDKHEQSSKKNFDELENKEKTTDQIEDEIDYNADHFGLKNIEIIRADMINSQGEVTRIFNMNDEVRIKMYYKVNKPLSEYVFGIGIYNLDGVCLYGNNTQLDRIHIPHTSNSGIITCKIKNLPLLGGRYILNVAVVDRDGTPMDFYRKYCEFDVISTDRSTGYFSLEHSWEE